MDKLWRGAAFRLKAWANLVLIDGIMNQHQYLKTLKDNLKQSAEKMGTKDTFKLYQDNDPKHKAYKVRPWLLYKVIDMNPIENVLNELDRRVRQKPVSSITELKKDF